MATSSPSAATGAASPSLSTAQWSLAIVNDSGLMSPPEPNVIRGCKDDGAESFITSETAGQCTAKSPLFIVHRRT